MPRVSVREDFEGEMARKLIAVRRHYGLTANIELIRLLIAREYERIREALPPPPRLEHINVEADYIRIRDLEVEDREIRVHIRGKKLLCDYCESESCRHVDFVWDLSKISDGLRAAGFRPSRAR